jgi:hypothetical protein
LIHAISSIAIATLYSTTCLLLGLVILPGSRAKSKTFWYVIAPSAFLIGQCVFSVAWLALGLAGQFGKPLIVSTLILAVIASLPFLSQKLSSVSGVPNFVDRKKPLGTLWYGLLAIIGLWAVKVLFATLDLQPQGDAEAFYMVIAKITASSHRLAPQPNFLALSQAGFFGELHYAALMALSGVQAAKLISWFTAIAATLMVVALCEEAGVGSKGKIVAVILVMTSSAFTNRIMDGKVDVYGAALGLAAYYWALREHGQHAHRDYAMSGIFCGFAIVAKLTNMPVVVPGLILIIIINRFAQSKEYKTTLRLRFLFTAKDIALFASMICVAMVPHFVKNAMLFHEPFAPFFFLREHGSSWALPTWLSAQDTAFLLATYPIALTFGHYPTQWGTISPLVLGFIPLAFLLPRNGALLRSRWFQMSLAASVGVVLWMAFQPSFIAPRYLLATLLLFVPLASKAAENILESERMPQVCSTAILSALIILSLVPLYPQIKGPINRLLGRVKPATIAESMGEYYQGLQVVNLAAAPGDRVMLVGPYGYHLRPDLLQCMFNDVELDTLRLGSPGRIIDWRYAALRACKFIILQKHQWPKAEAQIAESESPKWLHMVIMYNDSNQAIYRMEISDTTIKPVVATRQINPPAWDVVPVGK